MRVNHFETSNEPKINHGREYVHGLILLYNNDNCFVWSCMNNNYFVPNIKMTKTLSDFIQFMVIFLKLIMS